MRLWNGQRHCHDAVRRDPSRGSADLPRGDNSDSGVAPQQRYEEPRETSSAETADLTSRANRRETAEVKPKPSSQPRVASTQSEIPVAKAVPGKPGYVFSPFDASGRYVDVSGYQPGTKVKDPWTNKIFTVP